MKFLQIQTRFFMGKRYLLLLLSVSPLILSGCDGAQKAATEYVAQQMRDPSSAKFRDVQTVTDSADPYVQNICGFVNGKNLFGAYTGEKRFVVEIFTGPQKSTFTPLRFIVEGDDNQSRRATKGSNKTPHPQTLFEEQYWNKRCLTDKRKPTYSGVSWKTPFELCREKILSSLEIKGDVPVVADNSINGDSILEWYGDNEFFVPTSTPNVMDLRRVRCVVNNASGEISEFNVF
ncbi:MULTISPECIES: hypothetical protein [Raoultella]|uniref:hypothetical protein n=1 Tax=Klebsiella/Raoultella group TaxID=2890311 RepID=UPI000BFBC6C2|nr:hypothetical protein [Raoultella planticola]EJG2382520.1 hypothetical protein [Raoultella ornithinolytica]EKV8770426.1 hypothetical protein [Klebsiella variicola]MCJ6282910.1 hypothetical protein [Klebsiella pneumoniae]NHJ97546.1 hypothetical protein [Klebsiella quasipneumoniae subsp. similipneumoniae]ATM05099.1 hypothetical protein CRT62_10935 [Raoultella planticola]